MAVFSMTVYRSMYCLTKVNLPAIGTRHDSGSASIERLPKLGVELKLIPNFARILIGDTGIYNIS